MAHELKLFKVGPIRVWRMVDRTRKVVVFTLDEADVTRATPQEWETVWHRLLASAEEIRARPGGWKVNGLAAPHDGPEEADRVPAE